MAFYGRRVARGLEIQEALREFDSPPGVDPALWRQQVANRVVLAVERADGDQDELGRLARRDV